MADLFTVDHYVRCSTSWQFTQLQLRLNWPVTCCFFSKNDTLSFSNLSKWRTIGHISPSFRRGVGSLVLQASSDEIMNFSKKLIAIIMLSTAACTMRAATFQELFAFPGEVANPYPNGLAL